MVENNVLLIRGLSYKQCLSSMDRLIEIGRTLLRVVYGILKLCRSPIPSYGLIESVLFVMMMETIG
jgi:hypothetical protein